MIVKKRNSIVAAIIAGMVVLSGCGTTTAEPVQAVPTEAVTPAVTEAPTETETEEPTEAPTEAPAENTEAALEDGEYLAKFDTDSSMFHVNEVSEGRGTLVVKDGEMRIHLVMPSKNVVNLYYGLAEDAQKDGAQLIEPTVESVTYPDGLTEEVYAYDVPVPYLDEEFDVALIGTKGVWYDHKVSVSDPVVSEESVITGDKDGAGSGAAEEGTGGADIAAFGNGEYRIDVTLEGGSGRATITSPAVLTIEDGEMTLLVEWSSPNYDYMLVGEEKFEPVNTDGNSQFEIPVASISEPLEVVGDTVAMSEPHEIEYTIIFDEDSIR